MKKTILTIIAILAAALANAGDRVVERTYLSTDKACYVAGDNIWLSAFCLDAADGGKPSNFSSIAYVELCSASGVEATAKVALMDGRGAGNLVIPRSLPTGNYKLIAYTAQNRNEVGYDFFETSKTVSVFNTFTSERAKDNVEIVSDAVYGTPEALQGDGKVAVAVSSKEVRSARISLSSKLSKAASLSVSVYHEDALKSPLNDGVAEFLGRVSRTTVPEFTESVITDFEGEVIVGHCVGKDAAKYVNSYAVIASPSDLSGIYYSAIESDGSIKFCTNNYYGDNVLVCQIESQDEVGDAHIEFDSPFVDNKASDIAKMQICPGLEESLSLRGTSMQIEKLFVSDTLFDKLPQRPNLLLEASEPTSYILKDYTRFPVMNEVFVELVKGLKFKHEDKKPYVHVTLLDSSKPSFSSARGALVLVDGIPVLDHQKIYDYDPLLVERIDVYPATYFVGPRCCLGIVNMVTYKRNMPTLTFPDAVRVVDFQGACFPQAYTCRGISENANYPDYRSTVYWHPMVDLKAGESLELDCQLPKYEGSFRVVVEGISEDGEPVYETLLF